MADPRRLLKDSWAKLDEAEHAELERLGMEMWQETLAATKGQLVQGVFECRHCHKQNKVEIPVEVPDIVTRAKAFAILADQGFGKVEETKTVVVDIGARTLQALESLSMQELAQYAAGDDAEWEPLELPPAA